MTQLVQTVEEIIAADSKGWFASNTVAKALSKAAGDEAAETGDPDPRLRRRRGESGSEVGVPRSAAPF